MIDNAINLTIYLVGLFTIIDVVVRISLKTLKWLISNNGDKEAEHD